MTALQKAKSAYDQRIEDAKQEYRKSIKMAKTARRNAEADACEQFIKESRQDKAWRPSHER